MPVKAINQRATFQRTVNGHAKHTNKLVLVLNASSSSLKFALFHGDASLTLPASGIIGCIGTTAATFTVRGISGQTTKHVRISAPDHVRGLNYLLQHLVETAGVARFRAASHRLVREVPRACGREQVDPNTCDSSARQLRSNKKVIEI